MSAQPLPPASPLIVLSGRVLELNERTHGRYRLDILPALVDGEAGVMVCVRDGDRVLAGGLALHVSTAADLALDALARKEDR